MNDHTTTPSDPSGSSGRGAGIVHKALEPIIRAVRDELTSARKEISDRVSQAKTGLILTVAGALLGLVALGLVAALVVVLLALVLPLWAGTAITLAIFLIGAAILIVVGLRGIRRGVPPIPRDTLARKRATAEERS